MTAQEQIDALLQRAKWMQQNGLTTGAEVLLESADNLSRLSNQLEQATAALIRLNRFCEQQPAQRLFSVAEIQGIWQDAANILATLPHLSK